ncbi:MAG: archaellin/type IV pilin N-terminal domain-containing protein [Anaerolineae bacterium]
MLHLRKFNQNQRGQTALEAAIILIAFVVVASIFAFAILSAGTASTERGEQAIYSGLEGVQSSMQIRGAVVAESSDVTTSGATPNAGSVTTLTFTVALAAGNDPVDLTSDADARTVLIGYRDGTNLENNLDWTVTFIGNNDGDALLEDGELAQLEVTVPIDSGSVSVLAPSTQFTIEVKPPSGAVLTFTRTTPAAIEAVMELR